MFEIDVEMALTAPTGRQMGMFERALDIASGVITEGDWSLLHANFTVSAVSYWQAVWRAASWVLTAR